MRAKLALLITLVTPVAAVPAQVAPAPGTATTIGSVFDSVRMRPMSGARIRLDTTSLVTIADGDGRFRLDSIPPGEHWLRVDYPVLDTLGIQLRTTMMTLHAGETRVAQMGTPSPESLVQRFCSEAWRSRGPAALMGKVRDAESGNPAVGVKVSLVWYEIETVGTLRRAPRVREAVVAPDGIYRICGLPAQLDGKAQVIRGNLTSGDVPISFGEDVLALRSMSIAEPEAVIAQAPPVPDSGAPSTQPPPPRLVGTARLTGRIVNKVRQPIVGARVQLEGTTRAVDTRADGEFTLDSLPPGTQTVAVRKLGFAPIESAVDLVSRTTSTVTLQLDDFVPVLETVRVNAQRERALDDVGFMRRKRIGSGWYLDGRELEGRKQSLNFSDVLRVAPGIVIQRAGDRQYIASSRDPMNGCVSVWIDGTQWQQLEPGDIDDFVRPHELAAIEVYTPTTTPAEYQGVSRGNCSTVVVWTVRRLDRIKR